MKLCKKCRPGEPMGSMTVHTPDEAVRATRTADGGTWIADVTGSLAVRVLMRKGWVMAAPSMKEDPRQPIAKVKQPSKQPVKPKSKPKAKAKKSEPVPLDLLDLSISALEAALDSGKYDKHLKALLDAENAGKTRKGAVAALKARIEGK